MTDKRFIVQLNKEEYLKGYSLVDNSYKTTKTTEQALCVSTQMAIKLVAAFKVNGKYPMAKALLDPRKGGE
jgi:hypothetical protein